MTICGEFNHDSNIQPIQTTTKNYSYPQNGSQPVSDALCLNPAAALWPVTSPPSVTSTFTHYPEPLIPDVNKERMFEMDGIALAAFRPFKKNAKAKPNLAIAIAPLPPSSTTILSTGTVHLAGSIIPGPVVRLPCVLLT